MPITIGSNIASLTAQRRLSEGTSQLSNTYERLSSGQRINRASDDAAGLAIADSLNAGSRIFNQGVRNLNDGISLLTIADSAIENLTSIVVRLEELAEQSANGTYGVQQRKALDAEAQALRKEYFRISKTTKFNGLDLLGGSLGRVNLQAGFGTDSVLSAGVGGAIGTGQFETYDSYDIGGDPNSIATGDFNGDGMLDIVAARTGSAISVMLGEGGGTFATAISYSTGAAGGSVKTGDFNGDGILDVVTSNTATSSVSILIGTGNGSFGAATTYSAGSNIGQIETGDFNGDGNLDLVAVSYAASTATILLGTGSGSFGTRISYATGSNPTSVGTGDFNGDGILDLVTTEYGDSTVSLRLGTGGGNFGSRFSFSTGDNPYSVAIGDFNGDDKLDLVTADYYGNTASVLLGTGAGSFGTGVSYATNGSSQSVATGDFNGDGFLDFVTADSSGGGAMVRLGDGSGGFGALATYLTSNNALSVTTGDFNGDGVSDLGLVVFTAPASINVLIGETGEGVAPLLPFSLKTAADARQALPVFKQKRDQLAAQRGQIGAFQSRISVATNILQVTSENFNLAESRIRDADIAAESAQLVRLNILQQAASSVLGQANLQPSLALRLLQN